MKLLDVINEQRLDEINMSPSNLKTIVSTIDARAGMEFEMIVPGASQEEDGDMEPDIDSDESVGGIQDAYDFFYDGDYNSRRDVDRLRDRMSDDYRDWVSNQFSDRWDTDQDTFIYNYLKENASNDEIAEILGREDDDEDTKDNYGRKEVAEAVDKVMEEGSGNYWYDQAYESAFEDYIGEDHEMEWLEDNNINTMWDVQSNYDITWPHYYNPSSGGEVSVDDVADEFSRMINKPVNASNNYHGARREAGHYVVEPDGSLDPDEPEDGGLEFVSPPLPVDELIEDLKKVKAWADEKGCYTNDSTGLHINVSVPGFDMDKLDFVKLAILMGDEYILKEFGRQGNTYCKSAMKIVKDNITQRPEDVKRLLDTMKEHLNTSAAKLIHSGNTSKYTSINTKTGYIEFRSPGGDWLNENFDKIENTLYRFVVALDAALDETKYKQEYSKKLYKLLVGDQKDNTNTLAYFARYAAGELPQSALKSFIKQAQLERKVQKDPTGGQRYWWSVGRPGFGASVQVVATSKEEAIEKGKQEYPDWANATNMTAKPIRPFETESKPRYEIYNKLTGNGVEDAPARVGNDEDAQTFLNDYIDHGPHSRPRSQAVAMFGIRPIGSARIRATVGEPQPAGSVGQSQTDMENRMGLPDQTGDANYEIVDRRTGRRVFVMVANTEYDARRKYADWLSAAGYPIETEDYGFREINQQSNASGRAETSPTGQWKIIDGLGREIYRFRPAVNTRAKANELAAVWARELNFDGNYQVEPVGHNDSTPRPIPGVTDIEPDISGPDIRPASPRTDRPFVWKVIGSSQSPYQRQGTEVVARSEFEAMQKARQQWDLNTSGATEEQFFSTNGWSATPVRPAPVAGSTQDLQQQRAQGGFTGAWKIVDNNGRELYRFSGIGNSQADANRVAQHWVDTQRAQGREIDARELDVLPVMG